MATEDTTPAAVPGITRWRKKPADVDAIQWTGSNFAAVKDFASGAAGAGEVMRGALPLWVVKSQALCHVQRGDWIIREADGSGFYPCAGDVFAATYEAAEDTPAGDRPAGTAEAKQADVAAFWLTTDEDGDIILSAPCADTLGCLWSSHASGERVTLGELAAAASAHTGMAAGQAHAALAAATGETEDGPPNDGNPVIWSGAVAPGGFVCAVPVPGNPDQICGNPVESEPCTEHGEAGDD